MTPILHLVNNIVKGNMKGLSSQNSLNDKTVSVLQFIEMTHNLAMNKLLSHII